VKKLAELPSADRRGVKRRMVALFHQADLLARNRRKTPKVDITNGKKAKRGRSITL